MVKLATPIPEEVKKFFVYSNGDLIRIAYPTRWGVKTSGEGIGKPVGHVSTKGYLKVKFREKALPVHRIIWFLVHGEMPVDMQIDHKDENKLNNHIDNLRLATNGQNAAARSDIGATNKTGVRNVYTVSGMKNTWQVNVSVNGKTNYFGSYKDLELAELVATEARSKIHGEFANHG